jgi:glycosyltransferase involved in cell wall biosynthesis
MLSYEPGEMERYKYGRSWIRLLAIKYVQAWSLKRASKAVFLTKYASDVIQRFTGQLDRFCYIPHGVGSAFLNKQVTAVWPKTKKTPITCIYVSNLAPYKHQWIVIEALQKLRSQGYNLTLKLVGDNNNVYMDRVESVIHEGDMEWIELLGHTDPALLPDLLSQSNIFIFASSCENMPNSLVEAMAVGLPIACSDRGPMPEVLCDGGLYFDPENHHSIASCVERIITEDNLRDTLASKAKLLAERYSWERCSHETFSNLVATLEEL